MTYPFNRNRLMDLQNVQFSGNDSGNGISYQLEFFLYEKLPRKNFFFYWPLATRHVHVKKGYRDSLNGFGKKKILGGKMHLAPGDDPSEICRDIIGIREKHDRESSISRVLSTDKISPDRAGERFHGVVSWKEKENFDRPALLPLPPDRRGVTRVMGTRAR